MEEAGVKGSLRKREKEKGKRGGRGGREEGSADPLIVMPGG